MNMKPIPYLLFTIVFLTVFTLYSLTLAPGVVGGDAGEHQFAAPLLGIPHATGYPLYILLGKLWTLVIPMGGLAWRMNWLSAFFGAAAAGMTSLVVYQLGGQRSAAQGHEKQALLPLLAAFIAGLTLAYGLTLWQWSVIAGVRSLNVLFFAVLTWQAIRWQQQRQMGHEQAAERTLSWLALTVGLSLAHHRTTVFYLPWLILWIGWHDRQLIWQVKRLVKLTALTIAPLSLYAFIYFRGISSPPYSHEQITDFQSFWFLVGASDSSGLFLHVDPQFLAARLAFIWHDILAQLSWPGMVVTAIGAISLARHQPRHMLLQGALVLTFLLFVVDFEVVNLNEAPTWYLMPAYFIFAVWSGIGLITVGQRIPPPPPTASHLPPPTYRLPPTSYRLPPIAYRLLPPIYLLLLTYTLALPNWQQIDRAASQPLDGWRQRLRGTQAERFVASSLPKVEPHSLLLGDWEQYTPMMYYRLIDGLRPDVEPRLPLDNWPDQVAAAQARNQPVYFMRKTDDLIGWPHLSMVGPLIHLQTEPNFDRPTTITLLEANLEDELELIGYRLERFPQTSWSGQQADSVIQLMLYWRALHPLEWDYALSFRLMDRQGQLVYQRDTTHPVLSSYPTSLWTPQAVVGDFYEFLCPPNVGPLTLHILPYRHEGEGEWHNLTLNDADPSQIGVQLLIK